LKKEKRAKLKKLMETEKNDFSKFHNFFLINKKKPLSDHIGWCSFTHTPNFKKNPRDRGGDD
jgi:hypothetical protein